MTTGVLLSVPPRPQCGPTRLSIRLTPKLETAAAPPSLVPPEPGTQPTRHGLCHHLSRPWAFANPVRVGGQVDLPRSGIAPEHAGNEPAGSLASRLPGVSQMANQAPCAPHASKRPPRARHDGPATTGASGRYTHGWPGSSPVKAALTLAPRPRPPPGYYHTQHRATDAARLVAAPPRYQPGGAHKARPSELPERRAPVSPAVNGPWAVPNPTTPPGPLSRCLGRMRRPVQ